MYTKGIELTRQKPVKYCTQYHCHKSNLMCAICISPECCESSSKWFHISLGEHICSICYNRIHSFFSYDKECSEISNWRKRWLRRSHENPKVLDFISERLLSTWCECCECGKWRQVGRDVRLEPLDMERFECRLLIPVNGANRGSTENGGASPCEVPEDARIDLVRRQPQEFLDSLKYRPLLETVPFLDELFGDCRLDLLGVSPAAAPMDFDLPTCPGFLERFHPFLRRSRLERAVGSIDPGGMAVWEHVLFPGFSGPLRPLLLGLRNLLLAAWHADPRRPVTERLAHRCVRARGLLRVALLAHALPEALRVYGGLGYLNCGFLPPAVLPRPLFNDETSFGPRVAVLGGGLAGLAAANHLRGLGLAVTVVRGGLEERHSARAVLEAVLAVHGAVNNPLVVAAHQLGLEMRALPTEFAVYDGEGRPVSPEADRYVEGVVYGFLDRLRTTYGDSEAGDRRSLQDLYAEYRSGALDPAREWLEVHSALEALHLAELEHRVLGGVPLSEATPGAVLEPVVRGSSAWGLRWHSGGDTEPACGSWAALADRLEAGLGGRQLLAIRRPEDGPFVLECADGAQVTTVEAEKVLVTAEGLGAVQGLLGGEWPQRVPQARVAVLRMVLAVPTASLHPERTVAVLGGPCTLMRVTAVGEDRVQVTATLLGTEHPPLDDGTIVEECLTRLVPLYGPLPPPLSASVSRLALACVPAPPAVPATLLAHLYVQRPAAPACLADSFSAGLALAAALVADLL